MKRIVLLTVICALAAPATSAFAESAGRWVVAGSGGRRASLAAALLPRSELTAFACHRAAQPDGRSISVRAVMRPVAGTQKMEMRFELLSRSSPGAAFAEVAGSGLESWISPPDPTLGQRPGDVWIVPDLVRNLPAPAAYRYRVSFRWTGTGGKILATAARTTRDCHQPLFRPDLLVSSIAIEALPDQPAMDKYVATIENDGQAPAVGPFSVTFTHGPGPSATPPTTPTTTTKTIQRLYAGPSNEVNLTFFGPACTASTAPTVVVDPDSTVDESDFTNNSLTVDPSCPALSSAPIPTASTGTA